jgi:hypothetical protein
MTREKRSIYGRLSDHLLISSQRKQQQELAEKIGELEGVHLKASIIRNPRGKEGQPLEELDYLQSERNQILMLLAGATDRMTYLEQAMPHVFSLIGQDGGIQTRMLAQVTEEILASGKAGPTERVIREARDDTRYALSNPMGKINFPDYIKGRALQINQEVFQGEECDLTVIRNASAADLRTAVAAGGGNRALLFHGHSNRTTFCMTDEALINQQLEKPKEKLRALIVDACGNNSSKSYGNEDVGEGISDNVFGFDRMATIRDIFGMPMRKKP